MILGKYLNHSVECWYILGDEIHSLFSLVQIFYSVIFYETEAHIYSEACQELVLKFETLNGVASAESV